MLFSFISTTYNGLSQSGLTRQVPTENLESAIFPRTSLSTTMSASRNTNLSADAFDAPKLRAFETCGSSSTKTLSANLSATATEPSVQPLQTTISSAPEWEAAFKVASKHLSSLYTGTITDSLTIEKAKPF